MKTALLSLLLLVGGPLPFIEGAPSVEEDAVVEVSRPARRVIRVERLKRILLPVTTASAPPTAAFDAPLRPEAPHEPSAQPPRAPPAV
jgi:hypothetical protein